MTLLSLLRGEVAYAAEEDRPLLWVRVTEDALEGSPVALPVTPERTRQVRVLMSREHTDVGAAAWERTLELLVHPSDWIRAREELAGWTVNEYAPAREEFMGFPVLYSRGLPGRRLAAA